MRLTPLATAAAIAFAGCGGGDTPAAPAPGSWAGKVTGTDAFVAVVAGKRNVAAYVCDGAHRIAETFIGRRSGTGAKLSSERGGRLSVTLASDSADGTVTLADGRHLRFAGRAVAGDAGWYRAAGTVKGQLTRVGWVVLPDGAQRGAVTSGKVIAAAPQLDTASRAAVLPAVGKVSIALINPASVNAQGFNGSFTGGGFG
jgi:hypothetical protein